MKNEQQLTQVSQLKRPRQRMEKRFNSTNLNGDPKACVCQEVKTILMQFKVIEQVSKGSRQMIQEVKQEGTFKAKPRVPSSPMQLVPLSYPSQAVKSDFIPSQTQLTPIHSVASHLQMTTLILTVGLQVISKPTVNLTVVYICCLILFYLFYICIFAWLPCDSSSLLISVLEINVQVVVPAC